MLAPVTLDTQIRLRCEAEPGAALVLALLPARTHHQQLASERLRVRGATAQSVFTEAATATRYLHVTARGGALDVELAATVRLLQAEVPDDRLHRDAPATPLSAPESLRFLLPSRWCPSDRLVALAAREFVQVAPPFERALAVDRWVRRHLRGLPPSAAVPPAAPADGAGTMEALERGAGTPRELAHLTIALCRAARLPARYVSTVPLGSSGEVDLHPWVEVLVGDTWLAVDPSRRVPRTALLRLGTGRDAADVPLAIAHGEISAARVELSLDVGRTSIDALRERDLAATAICAATLGSLAEATHWHQAARLAARRPAAEADAGDPPRPAPSRLAAAAARVATTTPRALAPVLPFPVPNGVRLPPGESFGSRYEPV